MRGLPEQGRSSLPPVRIGADHRRHSTVLHLQERDNAVYVELMHGRGRDRHGSPLLRALVALSVLLLASFLVIRHQLKPIARIQQGVRRMAQGELDRHIDLPGQDDLALLGGSVDAMATRIQAMLDAKRQLLLAISHELRSPLARARVAIELMDASPNRERLREDLDEMQRKIGDILESERLQQHAVLNLTSVELVELVERVAAASEQPIELALPAAPLPIQADATRLEILLRNLISNAIRHGQARGMRIALEHDAQQAILRVSDHGPGIPPQHLDAITEPFFRPDTARTREAGGVGLGLTLVRLIAEAHHGRLQIESNTVASANGVSGTRVTVTLPVRSLPVPS